MNPVDIVFLCSGVFVIGAICGHMFLPPRVPKGDLTALAHALRAEANNAVEIKAIARSIRGDATLCECGRAHQVMTLSGEHGPMKLVGCPVCCISREVAPK